MKNKQRITARNKKYQEEHKEQIAKQHKAYAKKHAKKRAAYLKKYGILHKKELQEKRKVWESKNRKHLTKYYLDYQKGAGKLSVDAAHRKSNIRHPLAVRARGIINNLLRSGDLTLPKICTRCKGFFISMHAHHEDYRLPEEIVWLCKDCHYARHREIKKQKIDLHSMI